MIKPSFANLCAVLWVSHMATASQFDYKVEHHYVELIYINKEFISSGRLFNVKPNRTIRAYSSRFCTKTDLTGQSFKLNVHGFYENPILQETPLVFDVNICDALTTNLFGISSSLMKYGNLTKCPIRKGCYVTNNWIVEDAELPPFLPAKKYLFKFKAYIFNKLLAEAHWHGEVVKVI